MEDNKQQLSVFIDAFLEQLNDKKIKFEELIDSNDIVEKRKIVSEMKDMFINMLNSNEFQQISDFHRHKLKKQFKKILESDYYKKGEIKLKFGNKSEFLFKSTLWGLISLFFIMCIVFLSLFYNELFTDKKTNSSVVQDSSFYYDINVYIDPETKCEYLIYDGSYAGNITPRLNKNGKQICGKDVKQNDNNNKP